MARFTVVNRRLPGGVRGDWAVRKNGRVVSEGHKTQRKAEQVARRKARPGDRVVVQGVDGEFRKNDKVAKGNGRKRSGKKRRGRKRPRIASQTNAMKILKGKRDLV